MHSRSLGSTLFSKEARCLLAGRALCVLLIILSVLTGYSFQQAVNLFSEASTTALRFPELARGMTPLDGHVYFPELVNLLAGYTLYVLVIAAIAFLASAMTDSSSTAAIVTLGFTLGSWVLDYAAGSEGWLRLLSNLSLTAQLRVYEHGLFSLWQTLHLLLVAMALLALSVIWLHPGRPVARKAAHTTIVVAVGAAMLCLAVAQSTRVQTERRTHTMKPRVVPWIAMVAVAVLLTVALP